MEQPTDCRNIEEYRVGRFSNRRDTILLRLDTSSVR